MLSTRANRIVSTILLAVACVSLVMSFVSSSRERKTNEALTAFVKCQAEWNQFSYKAAVAGRNANSDTQSTMDGLVDAIYQAKSAEETRRAIEAYRAAREAQRVALLQNPYPPPPEEVCELG